MFENKVRRCLVIEDEPPARELLCNYIQKLPTLELSGACANAIEAYAWLQHNTVDLAFLDIRMPQLNGNDFLKTLNNPPQVIFTTAYPDYALEGYELNVVDYLLKPIPFHRFLKAVNKAFPPGQSQTDTAPAPEDPKSEAFVYFRSDRKMVKVLLGDILYIESMKDYIKIITDKETIITRQSISSVEEMLPETAFVRTHRSFMIALNKIKTYTSDTIEIGNKEIPIGKLYRNGVLKLLQQSSTSN
ncbi:MAG: LytTR family DNA-binding domain-containing protein [Saprospiraceae bacterium]